MKEQRRSALPRMVTLKPLNNTEYFPLLGTGACGTASTRFHPIPADVSFYLNVYAILFSSGTITSQV